MSNSRTAEQKRDTAETKVEVKIDIDGCGQSKINTGVAFFDHMLTLFSKHSLCDLEIIADGLSISFRLHEGEHCFKKNLVAHFFFS